uniref:UEV domain-containing protein n=1 Tax=Poecilia mexicana TaxID=48701 RepID=A0A3B3X7S1_9TELE
MTTRLQVNPFPRPYLGSDPTRGELLLSGSVILTHTVSGPAVVRWVDQHGVAWFRRFGSEPMFLCFAGFPNKETRRLLHLSGTLPVFYQGSAYNIPVCVWLHQTHPLSRPRCVVCPSVAMVINPSCPHVDSSGTVSVDGLRNWTPAKRSVTLSQPAADNFATFVLNLVQRQISNG